MKTPVSIFLLASLILLTAGPGAASAQSPYPDMVRLNGAEPVINTAGAMFPSLVKIPDWVPPEARAHPEAVYYLYWASHYGWYIRLSWSRTIEGPYTEFNSPGNRSLTHPRFGVLSFPGQNEDFQFANGVFIYAHISSPEVIIDDANERFVMFFHGPCNDDQKSFVATSPDGLNFNPVEHGGIEGHGVVPQIFASQYLRPFAYDGAYYGVAMHGVLVKSPDNALYITEPGPNPQQTLWTSGHAPVSGTVGPRHAAARVRDGRYLDYFFSRRIENEHIEVATIDMAAGPWTSWYELAPSVTVIDNTASWEGDDTRDPAVYEEAGSVYLLYAGGGENGIGLALLEGDYPLPTEPLPPDYDPDLVIDWGLQDVATASAKFRDSSPAALGDYEGYAFSDTLKLNPSSGYSGAPFYGGFISSSEGNMASSSVVNNSSGDQIDLRVQYANSFHGCLFFDSTDFHGEAGQPFTFGKYSVLRIKLDRHPGWLRFLVRNGTEYFVSQVPVDQSGELRFRSDDDDGMWAPYDPAVSLNFDNAQAFESRNFDNITGIGFVIDVDAGDGVRYWLRLQEFEVFAETPRNYASWIGSYPGLGALTGQTDDPDKDGLKNALEFVLGGHPGVPDPGLQPGFGLESVPGGLQPYLEFTPVHTIGVTFALESGDNLADWDLEPFSTPESGQLFRINGPQLPAPDPSAVPVFLRLSAEIQE